MHEIIKMRLQWQRAIGFDGVLRLKSRDLRTRVGTWDLGLYTWSGRGREAPRVPTYDRGEPTVTYKWTGWVWKITGWSSRLLEINDHFKRIYTIYPILTKENQRMSTCNRLELQTLESQPIMPKNLTSPITGPNKQKDESHEHGEMMEKLQ